MEAPPHDHFNVIRHWDILGPRTRREFGYTVSHSLQQPMDRGLLSPAWKQSLGEVHAPQSVFTVRTLMPTARHNLDINLETRLLGEC